MSGTRTLPTWLAVVVVSLATLACINHFFLPAFRWLVRRMVNRAIADVNTRFRLDLPTFQLTRLGAHPGIKEGTEDSAFQEGLALMEAQGLVASTHSK